MDTDMDMDMDMDMDTPTGTASTIRTMGTIRATGTITITPRLPRAITTRATTTRGTAMAIRVTARDTDRATTTARARAIVGFREIMSSLLLR